MADIVDAVDTWSHRVTTVVNTGFSRFLNTVVGTKYVAYGSENTTWLDTIPDGVTDIVVSTIGWTLGTTQLPFYIRLNPF